MTPEQVVEEVKASDMQGRGGAGFPTGTKWGFLPADVFPRYVVVNGDESEPGTYKDRILMERDPHQLIEGILLTCYAVKAAQAFLYVRVEMALARSASPRPSTTRTRTTWWGATSSARASTSTSR
jgi:NADH-quinone oxidoreductase subunit F